MKTSNKSIRDGIPKRGFTLVLTIFLLVLTRGTILADIVDVSVGGGTPMFFPDAVTIHPGDTIRWTWQDAEFVHTVTSGTGGVFDGLFNAGSHNAPFEFSYTFPNVGIFDYFCGPHYAMGMVGVINVVEAPTQTAIFGNISTRLLVQGGENVLIGGFIVTGTEPKRVIVRAIGPSLPLSGALADPTLELRDSAGALIRSNDNWRSDQEQEIMQTTIPPTNDLEAAIVATLPANGAAYTAIVNGANNGTGIGVVEAYDLSHAVDSKLVNISTRGLVQTGNNVMIGGLIVLGPNQLRVIVRAIGPSLPLAGKLADPTLELRDGNGSLIRSNDNWRSDQEQEIIQTGIPPSNDLESAIVATLPASGASYTAVVSGASGSTGVAVVEGYALN
jgi:plastocyanin